MDLMLKDITLQIDSGFDVKLKTLTNQNKELFLSNKFEHFRAEEIERQNENLTCQVEMLENVIEERRKLHQQDHAQLIEKYKVQLLRFKDDIEAQQNKTELVQQQLNEALRNEACLRNKVNEQEMAIESDLAGKKLSFVEKESDELMKRLQKKEEQLVEQEILYKTHELECPQVKADLEKKCKKFEKKIEQMEVAMEKESDDWRAKEIEMEKEIKRKGLDVESEIFNTKMQVSAVEEQKKREIEAAEKRVAKYKNRNKELQKSIKQKEYDAQKHQLDLERFEVEKLSLNNQMTEKDRKLSFLFEKLNKVDEIFESNRVLKLKYKKLQDEYKKMKEKMTKSEVKKRQLYQMVKSSDCQNSQSEEKENLQDRIKELKSEIQKLKNENSKVVSSKTEMDNSSERLRKELDDFQKKCQIQKEKIQRQKEEIEKQKEKIQALKKNGCKKSSSESSHSEESAKRTSKTSPKAKESLVATATYSDDSFEESSRSSSSQASIPAKKSATHKSTTARSNTDYKKDNDVTSIESEIAEEVEDNNNCDGGDDELSGDFFGNNNINFFLAEDEPEEIEEDIKIDSVDENETNPRNGTTKRQASSSGTGSSNKLQTNRESACISLDRCSISLFS